MNVIKIDPEIMGGTPCFNGTRVPVAMFFDWVADGQTTEFFLEQFPTVQRWHVQGILDLAKRDIVSHAQRESVSA